MSQNAQAVADNAIELPASAPQVRVTAGYGSAGQKTWNLRRPITLIGSKRPAHIVLHGRGISVAHCAIVNTGTDVLLFDLHTSDGTLCNKDQVSLAVMNDGDVISIGDTKIQVAIRMPTPMEDDSGCGVEFVDPARMPDPVTLSLIHTERQWKIEDAAVLIGRHEKAAVRLDSPDISTRHAILFRFAGGPGVFDLGSRSGVWVNGQRTEVAVLTDGDRLTVGQFGLGVRVADRKASAVPAKPEISQLKEASTLVPNRTPRPAIPSVTPPPDAPPPVQDSGAQSTTAAPSKNGESAADPLGHNIADAWQRLNHWRTQLQKDAGLLGERQDQLATREAELDARDAALRGQLHDITRFNEQLAQRESELLARAAKVQCDSDAVASLQVAAAEREAELQRRHEEVTRRENALAQRWSRMQSTTCPHCRKPINVGSATGTESG